MADYINPRKQGKEKMVFSYFLEKYTLRALPLATIISIGIWAHPMRGLPVSVILNIIIVLLASLGTGIFLSRVYAYIAVSRIAKNQNYKTIKKSLNENILKRLRSQEALVWPKKGDKNYERKVARVSKENNRLSKEISLLEYEYLLFDNM